MSESPRIDEIKQFWDSRAKEYGTDPKATLRNTPLRKMEIRTISKYLRDDARIIDIGCGNGFSTIQFARRYRSDFWGVDYSEPMVANAKEALTKVATDTMKGSLHFATCNVMDLPFDAGMFDIVVTERCIQNLPSWNLQIKAIKEIVRILVPGGTFLMNECSSTGLRRLNRLRMRLRMPELVGVMPWHNLFIEDSRLAQAAPLLGMKVQEIVDFSSTYMILTKAIGWPFKRFRQKISHLPPILNFGYDRLYVLVK